MQGRNEVARHLNILLGHSLISINQYFLHARMLKNWGLDRYANKAHGYAIQAMRHADHLVERILFLDHRPAMGDIGYLRIGETAEEMLALDLQQCLARIDILRQGISTCERKGDFVSRALLESVLAAIESEVDWHESQIALATALGSENFLQSLIA